MKNWLTSGFFVILLIGFLLISGCTSTGSTVTTTQPTITSTVGIATPTVPTNPAVSPVSTTSVPTNPTIIPMSTTSHAAYSSDDINRHFVDIAFGPDYSFVNKWNKELVGVAVTGTYNDEDVKLLNNFFKSFNSYSSYTKLPSEVKQGEKGDILLYFMPEKSIINVNSGNSYKISKNRETGAINYIYKVNPNQYGGNIETLYINSDLKGDARTHWILRALLYELGFPGETGNYPDSIFYSDSDTATSLNKVDLKALELMYGKKISFGMNFAQVKNLLFI